MKDLKMIGIFALCTFVIIACFSYIVENCIIHQWKDGVKTWKYQQYLERDDALTPPVALYECTKCGKIHIVGGDDSDIFEPIDPNQ